MPLATLVSPTKPPTDKGNAILSPEGRKRFFVVHGGLFSKDGVTLEDIRKLPRVGRQPGQEGLMCTHHSIFIVTSFSPDLLFRRGMTYNAFAEPASHIPF